jgi:hypothetical protein
MPAYHPVFQSRKTTSDINFKRQWKLGICILEMEKIFREGSKVVGSTNGVGTPLTSKLITTS